ncbi:MAG TPA: serine hydrolase domain-containing protein [Solirubrobacterales bacterium]|nr:serine hydrolase domain-containing protein [Solirubrobacterales bacterium]
MSRRLAVAALAGLVLAVACTPAQAVKINKLGDAAVELALKRVVKQQLGPPGAIAIIQRGSKRSVIKAGFGNLMPTERPHPSDHMRIASVAKAFSGAVALSLVSEGRLTLDTTVTDRLPDLPSAWSAVTLRDLLNHTSGIPSYTNDPEFLAFISANPQAYVAPRELLDYVTDEPLHFTPGTAYEYSNSDNIVIGLMAEAATGMSYETLLATHVFAPLGMNDTTLPSDSALPEPFIHGYDVLTDEPPVDVSHVFGMSVVWASGGIQSTPADLNRFVRGYVGGRLFDKEERGAQFQFLDGGSSEPPGPGNNAAGLALFRYRTGCGTVFGHTGNIPGYTQFAAATRDGHRSVTVSVNEQLSPNAGDPTVFQALQKAERRAVCAALTR